MRKRNFLMFVTLLVLAGLMAACGGAAAPDPDASPAIYAAAIRQLYTVDHTFGEPPSWPTLYVVTQTDDSVGTLEEAQSPPQTLTESERESIAKALSDLPMEVVWVASRDEAPISDAVGLVDEGNAVIITLGNIHPQEDGSVQVPASLYCGMLCATGMTYVVEQVDGVWQVTGTTGPVWMS